MKKPPTSRIVAWTIWLAVVLGSFAVLELPGLRDPGAGLTFSEFFWWLTQWSVVWFGLGGLLTWVWVHLLGPSVRRWIKSWRK